MNKPLIVSIAFASVFALAGCAGDSSNPAPAPAPAAPAPAPAAVRTIVFVWDGLRPDSVNPADTPNLYAMRQSGVWFSDNHSTYPTFTMMNGASFATGSFPGTTGFYGNTFWTPPQGSTGTIPSGKGAGGTATDYVDPVFTEDWSILTTLDAYYGSQLLLVQTLFQTAQAKGLVTAAVGKSGAAFIQDLKKGGIILDENTVFPQQLATDLQAAGYALPANIVNAYSAGTITLGASNGNPTAQASTVQYSLPNGVKANDASDASGAKATADNKYMMDTYLGYILPNRKPDLSLIWFRDPDSTEHAYGPGSNNYRAALAAQDARLGDLLAKLKSLGLDTSTNVIVVSDHGHSNVSGPLALFPLRGVSTASTLGAADPAHGWSVSGDVRSAEMLTNAGLTHVYDGSGCLKSGMSGIDAGGNFIYPVKTDASGAICGTANATYQTASYKVPATLPTGSTGDQPVVIAANGGSDYFYVPSHDAATVQKIVATLQKREEYGAIFVDSRYGDLPGTLPLSAIKIENAARKGNGQPDVVVSFAWDANATINGLPGIEFESFQGNRGMHGSFGLTDVHNTLVAMGPSFRTGAFIGNPSGNVDVAPTVAYVLGTSLSSADGRVLFEALAQNPDNVGQTVAQSLVKSTAPATGLVFQSPLDPTGGLTDTSLGAGTYSVELGVKDLTQAGKTYRYFDYAKAVRQ